MGRIAICLSGQPRALPLSYSYLKEKLLDPNDDVDIFLHAWFNPDDAGKQFESAQPAQNGRVGMVHPDTYDILKNEYQPKRYIIQKQRPFLWARDLIQAPTAVQEHLASMFYSMYISNYLKRLYEIEMGFRYDVVVRARYDLLYYQPICLNDYLDDIKIGYLLTSKRFQDEREAFNFMGGNTMTDIFAFGASGNMDIFSSTYQNFAYINTKIHPPYGENYLGYQVKVLNKLKVKTIPIDYEIMHRVEYRYRT